MELAGRLASRHPVVVISSKMKVSFSVGRSPNRADLRGTFAPPDPYSVYVVFEPQRLHVHPAHADALGAVEPGELFVSRCIGRSSHERRQRIDLAAQGASVAV